jgi:uncharacterized membrane protein YesL
MRLLAKLPAQAYESVFGTIYAGLKINLCLLTAGLPLLLALAAVGDPLGAWPFFVAVSSLCGPAVAAAFGAFQALSDGDHRVGLAFWKAYRTSFGRSLAVAAAAAGIVIVLAVDLQAAVGTRWGAASPMLALLIGVVAAATTAVLAVGGQRRDLRWTKLLIACAYLSVRKWYLSLFNLVMFGVLCAVVVGKPIAGLFLLPAPVLFVVWANTRHLTAPLLPRFSWS